MLPFLLALGAVSAAEPAGKVLFATGLARIVDAAGVSRPMARGDAVYAGEELVTGEGRAQLRLSDGSTYALEPFSRFRVDEYRYAEGLPARARRAFFSLLKGGFRAITGAVGSEEEASYRVRTPLADIGIRGTVYRARLTGAAERLDVAVTAGTVFLENEAGRIDVPAGRSAFVTGRGELPRLGPAPGGGAAADGEGLIPEADEGRRYPAPEPSPTPHPEPSPYPGPMPGSHPHPDSF